MKIAALPHRLTLAFGIAVPVLQFGRSLPWGGWPQPLEWFIFLDAYVMGALLLWGVVLAGRKSPAARPVLAAGWGFSCGILFRSFFGQLEDPGRHSGHEILVLAVKGVLLAFAVAGFVTTVRGAPSSFPDTVA